MIQNIKYLLYMSDLILRPPAISAMFFLPGKNGSNEFRACKFIILISYVIRVEICTVVDWPSDLPLSVSLFTCM